MEYEPTDRDGAYEALLVPTVLPLWYHWYVYDPVPPDGDAVKVTV